MHILPHWFLLCINFPPVGLVQSARTKCPYPNRPQFCLFVTLTFRPSHHHSDPISSHRTPFHKSSTSHSITNQECLPCFRITHVNAFGLLQSNNTIMSFAPRNQPASQKNKKKIVRLADHFSAASSHCQPISGSARLVRGHQ
jgi:hypothetical protein